MRDGWFFGLGGMIFLWQFLIFLVANYRCGNATCKCLSALKETCKRKKNMELKDMEKNNNIRHQVLYLMDWVTFGIVWCLFLAVDPSSYFKAVQDAQCFDSEGNTALEQLGTDMTSFVSVYGQSVLISSFFIATTVLKWWNDPLENDTRSNTRWYNFYTALVFLLVITYGCLHLFFTINEGNNNDVGGFLYIPFVLHLFFVAIWGFLTVMTYFCCCLVDNR